MAFTRAIGKEETKYFLSQFVSIAKLCHGPFEFPNGTENNTSSAAPPAVELPNLNVLASLAGTFEAPNAVPVFKVQTWLL